MARPLLPTGMTPGPIRSVMQWLHGQWAGDADRIGISDGSGDVVMTDAAGVRDKLDVHSKADANAAFARVVESALTVTVGSGGDYATINAALDALSRRYPAYKSAGIAVTLNLLTGFSQEETVYIERVDLSWITVTSDDATVPIVRSAVGKYAWFIQRGAGPTIDCLFEMDASVNAEEPNGFQVYHGTLAFEAGAGCKAADRGLDVHEGGIVRANGTIWSDATDRGVRVANGGVAHIRDAVATGCTQYGLAAGAGARVTAFNADFSGAGTNGILASAGASVMADGANVSGAGSAGIDAVGSRVDFNGGDASGCGGAAILAVDARVGALLANLSNATTRAIDATGATCAVHANGANMSGANIGIRTVHGARVSAASANIADCIAYAVFAASGSEVAMQGATATGAGTIALHAEGGARLSAPNVNAEGAGGTYGIFASAAEITFTGGRARKGVSDDASDIRVDKGGIIRASGTLSGGLSQTANAVAAAGIIFQ